MKARPGVIVFEPGEPLVASIAAARPGIAVLQDGRVAVASSRSLGVVVALEPDALRRLGAALLLAADRREGVRPDA